jgi:hypothetical protein
MSPVRTGQVTNSHADALTTKMTPGMLLGAAFLLLVGDRDALRRPSVGNFGELPVAAPSARVDSRDGAGRVSLHLAKW